MKNDGQRKSWDWAGALFGLATAAFVMASPAAQGAAQNPLVIDGKARFTVIAPECIRLEFQKNGEFVDDPSIFAVGRDARFNDFQLTLENGATVIDTGNIRLTYKPDGKPFSADNLSAEIKKGDATAAWTPGAPNNGNLGGTIRTVDGVYGPVDLGEGLLSRDGWHLLDDSRNNLFTKDWVRSRPETAGTDWYLFGYGYDYQGALQTMTKIGGPVPIPRRYALGAWYSRYWPYSSDDYVKIIKEYANHDFPLDNLVLDMDWHREGWTGWSWNYDLLPDPKKLFDWAHKQGVNITLNVHPADGVGPHEDAYADFMKALGKDPSTKEWLQYDAGDKKYLDALFEYTHAPKEDIGVDFWWLDWQQYPYTRSIPDLTNLQWLNHYYFKWGARNGKRGLSFSRWPGWGDHRHPIHFSGDAHTGWPMLAFEVPFTSTAGNVGCFYWSHDIGGHMGGRNVESYTRWVQFGATSAALRSHSTRAPDLDRRPWTYPQWAEDSMRIGFHLRSEIFPYIYSSVWEGWKNSTPLNRPMYLLHPEEERAYQNPQQYYYGDNMLAAPIVSPGEGPGRVGFQAVWFPEGVWHNWFTGERFDGGQEALAAADIDEFPLYVRAGVPLPLQPYTQRMTSTPLAKLVVRCYSGEEGKTGRYTLYEDDGISSKYENGERALTELTCTRKGGVTTVTVEPAEGSYDGQPAERAVTVELPATMQAASATANGAAAQIEYDANAFTNRIRVPAGNIRQRVEITVNVKDADQDAVRNRAAIRRLGGLLGEENAKSGNSLKETIALNAAAQSDELLRNRILAVGGIGFRKKNEGVYLYKGTEKVYFHAAPGVMDGDAYNYVLADSFGAQKQGEKTGSDKADGAAAEFPNAEPLQAAPALGAAAKRLAIIDFSIDGQPFSIEGVLDRRESCLSKWDIAGTFEYDKTKKLADQKFGPETGSKSLSTVYEGAGGQKANWRKADAENGVVDMEKHFYVSYSDRIAYAVTFIHSAKAQKASFRVGANDGAVAWLNGVQILELDGENDIGQEPREARAELKEGWNTLMLKISQHRGAWNFRVAIDAEKPIEEAHRIKK